MFADYNARSAKFEELQDMDKNYKREMTQKVLDALSKVIGTNSDYQEFLANLYDGKDIFITIDKYNCSKQFEILFDAATLVIGEHPLKSCMMKEIFHWKNYAKNMEAKITKGLFKHFTISTSKVFGEITFRITTSLTKLIKKFSKIASKCNGKLHTYNKLFEFLYGFREYEGFFDDKSVIAFIGNINLAEYREYCDTFIDKELVTILDTVMSYF